jgi:hypothetical protein
VRGALPGIGAADGLMRGIRERLLASEPANERPRGAGPAPPIEQPWQWNRVIPVGKGSPALPLLTLGWSFPEARWVWSNGNVARMRLPEPPGPSEIVLDFRLFPFSAPTLPSQRVRVSFDGRILGAATFSGEGSLAVIVPRRGGASDPLELEWELPDARSPFEMGHSADIRRLGIALCSISAFCLGS